MTEPVQWGGRLYHYCPPPGVLLDEKAVTLDWKPSSPALPRTNRDPLAFQRVDAALDRCANDLVQKRVKRHVRAAEVAYYSVSEERKVTFDKSQLKHYSGVPPTVGYCLNDGYSDWRDANKQAETQRQAKQKLNPPEPWMDQNERIVARF
eukprot:GHVS01076135.1.p1 GENE.GHVS01076135.1~~GHVS01076135.1.p1  ORF type:complete len:150 (+),score=13.84 GHVS01076135.1:232-681(+)